MGCNPHHPTRDGAANGLGDGQRFADNGEDIGRVIDRLGKEYAHEQEALKTLKRGRHEAAADLMSKAITEGKEPGRKRSAATPGMSEGVYAALDLECPGAKAEARRQEMLTQQDVARAEAEEAERAKGDMLNRTGRENESEAAREEREKSERQVKARTDDRTEFYRKNKAKLDAKVDQAVEAIKAGSLDDDLAAGTAKMRQQGGYQPTDADGYPVVRFRKLTPKEQQAATREDAERAIGRQFPGMSPAVRGATAERPTTEG